MVAGSIQSGFNSLQSLSGTIVSAPKALELVYASLLVYLIPIACIVCIGLLLSAVTRNSAAAVVGTLMVSLLFQLVGHPARAGRPAALPAQHPVQRLAGAAADPDRLVADHPRRLGVRDVRGPVAAGRLPGLHPPRRGRWMIPAELRERVLVVDDDPPLRRMLASLAERRGL